MTGGAAALIAAAILAAAAAADATGAAGSKVRPGGQSARVGYVHAVRLREGPRARGPEGPGLGVFDGPVGLGPALVASAPVGNGPGVVALNPATHTLYVADGANPSGANAGGDTVSVIDTRHCRAQDVSQCKGPWPTITVGNGTLNDLPSGIAIDEQTDTVYVTNGGANTVSVINGAACDASDHTGCDHTPASVPVGSGPFAIFADHANHTVYVANAGPDFDRDTVSMIDSATCNATDLAACPTTPPPAVKVGATPVYVDVDQATHTVYVTTYGALNGWAVFDANGCNATVRTGCGSIGHLAGDPIGPAAGNVDTANDTLYTANGDNTVSVFGLAHCDARDLSGCATDTPGTISRFPSVHIDQAVSVAVDTAHHSVYVAYQKDDSLLVVDTDKCNGTDVAGCAGLSPSEVHTGADPVWVVLDPQTQTLYAANQVDNNVSVIDAARCNAETTTGCRHLAPEVAISGAGGLAADPAVATTYVTAGVNGVNVVAMIHTSNCNARRTAGCTRTPPTLTVGGIPQAVAVDAVTHTVYVANTGAGVAGTVSVFDDRACNATDRVGCAKLSTLNVPGGNPDDIAVNTATDTIYVATITSSGPDRISVFNGASCNATSTGGCNQTPASVAVGSAANSSSLKLAVDAATNTIYAANVFNLNAPPPFLGNSVYVVNGATCDAAKRSGCGQTPASVRLAPHPPVGSNPFGIAVDQATDTVYTANLADGEHPGTVSVINGATCNGSSHAGCDQTPATARAGFGADQITVDQLTNQVYATNVEDASVTTIDGNKCNGTHAGGCDNTQTQATVGDYPGSISVDPAVGTAYVTNADGASVIPLAD